MNKIRCEDMAFAIIAEAERQDNTKTRDLNKTKNFKLILKDIDSLSNEFDAVGLDASIDSAGDIHITLVCEEIEITDSEHAFYRIARAASEFGFACAEKENLAITFVFPSIWERSA